MNKDAGSVTALELQATADDVSQLIWSPQGELMRVILDVVQGPLKGRQFVLDRHDTFIVGRSRFVHCAMPEDLALSAITS